MKKKDKPYLSWEEVRRLALSEIRSTFQEGSNQNRLISFIEEKIDEGESLLDGPIETYTQKGILEIKEVILKSTESLKLSKLDKTA